MSKITKIFIIISIIGIAILLYMPTNVLAANTTNGEMTIYSINIGKGNNGDSTLVESNGEYLLMDLGVDASYSYVNKFLSELGVTHFSLYISHFHGDHTGGFENGKNSSMSKLMQNYKIDHIYLPEPSLLRYKGEQVEIQEATYYRKIREFYEASSIQTESYDEIVTYLQCGSEFSFGSVNASVIGPVGMDNFASPLKSGTTTISPENILKELLDTYQNNCSLVTKLVCGEISFLTAGDMKTDGENALIDKYKNTDILNATIYKMSHHGLYPANGEKFLSYVKPDFSFVSNYADTGLGDDGKFWKIHTSQINCNKYGFVYMGGNENKTLQINVKNNKVSLYRYGENTQLNKAGWTEVVGGDGINRKTDYYYFGNDGYTLKNIQKINDKYYYLGTGGYRHYGIGKDSSYLGMTTCAEDGKKRYFSENDGSMYIGFNTIKDNSYDGLYYFNSDGSLVTSTNGDWEKVKIDNNYYSIYESGKISTDVFREYDGGMCYFDSDGKMLTGWQTINENKYYFNTKTGVRYTGFKKIGSNYYMFSDTGKMYQNTFKDNDSGVCYFGSNGKMVTGWKNIDGYKYYFDTETGARYTGLKKIDSDYYIFSDYGRMCKSTFKNVNGGKCYFGSDGKMVTGWQTINGHKYYFNTKTGVRYTGFNKIDSNYYMFSDTGKMYKNTFKKANGGQCYFGSDGKMVTGWQTINGYKYYFDKKTGVRYTGLKKIGSSYYMFSNAGRMCKKTFKKLNGGLCYFDDNGKMVTGWQTINGYKYYFNTKTGLRYTGFKKIGSSYYMFSETGKMYKNTFKKANGGQCYFGNNGKMVTGWQTIKGYKYYFNTKTGVRYTGLKKIGSSYYMFSNAGRMCKKTFKKLNGGLCYFDDDGKMVTGWKTINGKKYYFDKENGTRYIGIKKIDNNYYFFSNAGVLQINTTKTINEVKYKFDSSGKMINVPEAAKTSISLLTAEKNTITVKWKKKLVDGYELYISTSKNGEYEKIATIENGMSKSVVLDKLENNKKYYIKIRTFKKIGDYYEYSDYSAIKSIKTEK